MDSKTSQVITKFCSKCELHKNIQKFSHRNIKSGVRSHCKVCVALYNKKLDIKRKAINTKNILEIFDGTYRCYDCGLEETTISFYDWHHIDPTTKKNNISTLMNTSWNRVYRELIKCVLLCPNCHRRRHL